jgi:hypothetical protein
MQEGCRQAQYSRSVKQQVARGASPLMARYDFASSSLISKCGKMAGRAGPHEL